MIHDRYLKPQFYHDLCVNNISLPFEFVSDEKPIYLTVTFFKKPYNIPVQNKQLDLFTFHRNSWWGQSRILYQRKACDEVLILSTGGLKLQGKQITLSAEVIRARSSWKIQRYELNINLCNDFKKETQLKSRYCACPDRKNTFLGFLIRYLWLFSAFRASRTQGKIPRLVRFHQIIACRLPQRVEFPHVSR